MAYTGMMVSLDTLEKLKVPTAAGMMLVRTTAAKGTQAAIQKASPSPNAEGRTRPNTSTPSTSKVDQILMMFSACWP